MRKLCVCVICLASPLAASGQAQADYWTNKSTVVQAPYAPPPYSCVTNYYVAANGSDANSGTSAAPWRTIAHAVSVLYGAPHGGVCINVGPGTYIERLYVPLRGSGDTPTGYVVFRSSTPHTATILQPNDNKGNNVVYIDWSRFVIFDGFNISGYPSGYTNVGFFVTNSDHIKMINNVVHDLGSGGIIGIFSDYLTAQANVVYNTGCCDSSGVSAIDFGQLKAVDTNLGFHNFILNNISFSNRDTNHWEGNGIMVDANRFGPSGNYTPATLIENNLSYGNDGVGIMVYESDNVTVRNNTVFDNQRDSLRAYPSGILPFITRVMQP